MPNYRALDTADRSRLDATASCGLSVNDSACIKQLIGHTLARVERELILETLRSHGGNRTRAADLLGISIRSLRDKIRNYKDQGEDVPAPESACGKAPAGHGLARLRH